MTFKVGDMVPYEQYRDMMNKANDGIKRARQMYETLKNAKSILDAPITKNNLVNVINTLEVLSTDDRMQRFVSGHIMRSAKRPNTYCRIIKERCEKIGRRYNGFNAKYNTFNNLQYWFVYEAFKEKAICNPTGSFAFRFKDALVAYILSQQKYLSNNMQSANAYNGGTS
jgi:hypothetical protein